MFVGEKMQRVLNHGCMLKVRIENKLLQINIISRVKLTIEKRLIPEINYGKL